MGLACISVQGTLLSLALNTAAQALVPSVSVVSLPSGRVGVLANGQLLQPTDGVQTQ